MSYQALYRKWRPVTFDEVKGQDAIITTLKNQIKTDRIGHAYLFCGTRGTGKTSIAKIFARAVNCKNAKELDGNPCNQCEICKSILNNSSMNIFEIDAASNNGVDNIRDIKEQVEYPPTEGRYKVFIIDEVHMLSTSAFNALLKTLEEPPQYVIFILATTDPQKIPQTILSRCQQYDFRRMTTEITSERLKELITAEELKIDERAVNFIARAGDGSMRDALSLLDKCLAYNTGEELSYKDVLEILGVQDTITYSEFYKKICSGDIEAVVKSLSDMLSSGCEINQIINDFIWYLRNMLLCGSMKENEDILEISDENFEILKSDYQINDRQSIIAMMSSMSELLNRLRFSTQKRILFEVELIKQTSQKGRLINHAVQRGEKSDYSSYEVRKNQRSYVSGNINDSDTNAFSSELVKNKEEGKKTKELSPKIVIPDLDQNRNVKTSSNNSERLLVIRKNWNKLISELMPSNRAVFSDTKLADENGYITVIFRNSINYRVAATNRFENGLTRLGEITREMLGMDISYRARIAKASEFDAEGELITDEELGMIHFHIDVEN